MRMAHRPVPNISDEKQHTSEHLRRGMDGVLAQVTSITCSLTVIAFTLIGVTSRRPALELRMQNLLSFLFIIDAILLILIERSGGTLWSSKTILLPLAVICLMLAVAARLNLRGEQISQGANPHSIRRMRQNDESE